MQEVLSQPNHPYSELLRISQGMGVLKRFQSGKYSGMKIAFDPFVSTKAYYHQMGQVHEIWHRVLLKAAQDRQFIIDVLGDLAKNDEMLGQLFKIFLKRDKDALRSGVCLNRIDYYNNQKGQPKLTQYNLQCVGWMSHMEYFQNAKGVTDPKGEYINCSTLDNFAFAVKQLLNLKKMEGIMLFIFRCQSQDLLDQARMEIGYRKQGIKVLRATLKEMYQKLVLKENGDLYFGQEKVGVVYLRGLYQLAHYKFEGFDIQNSWKAREKVLLSNAISIPPIEFELINLKRVQTELIKPEVLRRYASEEEAKALMNTRVGEWEFDSISQEQLKVLTKSVEADPNGFLLKPNRQGGGNNLFGEVILQKLKGDRQQLRNYILMERINTIPVENVIIDEQSYHSELCEYQVSRFGTLTWLDGKIIRNQAEGPLIRAKPSSAKEGGILAGSGSFVSWKVTD